MKDACRIIIDNILDGKISSKNELEVAKRKLCRDHKLKEFMSNSKILQYANSDEKDRLVGVLQKKPTRTISGVAIVAVMCKPHKCPHGRCFYCPESDIAPPSYTGEEPAALRARMFNFHPYLQTYNRLKQLYTIGHPIDKVELIIMGGTFPSRDICYQEWFVSKCLQAMVDFGISLDDVNFKNLKENPKIIPYLDSSLKEKGALKEKYPLKLYPPNDYLLIDDVQLANESSKVRCVGITFETRPDYCKVEEVDRMLNMGVTRVELGVQTIYNFIYKKMERGHTITDVIDANRILRDSAVKVAMHFMPGFMSDFDRDLRIFKRVFSDPSFKPDMLKIYPCLVTKGSKLHEEWQNGNYIPYTSEESVDLIVEIKKILPKWVRTMRIQRDIPATLIDAGVKKSNLGELVYNRLDEENIQCQCIRCREVGHQVSKGKKLSDDISLLKETYTACEGRETFLSFEDKENDILTGFLRMRYPSKHAHRKEISHDSALIRELHVYGPMLEIGKKDTNMHQHKGYGEQLLEKAENLAIDDGKEKMLIISGIGVRNYYRKFGYEKEGPYMVKKLN